MGLRQMWRGHRQNVHDKDYIEQLLTRGMERFDISGPKELTQIRAACERVAAKSHGGTRILAATLSARAGRAREINATQAARDAAARDQRDMRRRQRDLDAGRLPIEKAGTITREGDHYRIDGWAFEGKDGQARELQPGEDATAATGWTTQQLINEAAIARAQERAEVRRETAQQPEPEAG